VDYIKIDGVFVRDILADQVDFEMVKVINRLGHIMGKQTIAEFVENDEIITMLTEIGVDYIQGYGVGKPRPIELLDQS
ncbi:MAG: EAL domain-containing protein, partial [Pseudomonadota bacterium]